MESFYKLFDIYIACPKGKYHPYNFTSQKEMIPDGFSGENWDLRCYYHTTSKFFLVFYLMNGKNVNVYLTNDKNIDWSNVASIEKDNIKETYDFLLKNFYEYDTYQMVALVDEDNSLKLEYYAFTLKEGTQHPISYEEKKIIDKKNFIQAYFKNDNQTKKYFYYFTYNDISDFTSGYSNSSIDEGNNYYYEVKNLKFEINEYPHLEFLYNMTIEEMNFLLYNKFLYYKLKSKENGEIYYGIFDIALNKIIFNTKEKIIEFIPFSEMAILATTKDKAYKICAYKDSNGNCIDNCANGYLLDVDGNTCGSSCPQDKLTFQPTGVCINKCDETYYIQSGSSCGLCKDLNQTNQYKLIGGTDCLNDIPANAYLYIPNLGLLNCSPGYRVEGNACVKDKTCYKLCKECTDESEDDNDQKCSACIDGFDIDNKNNCRCPEGKEINDKSCVECNNICGKYAIDKCDCEECGDEYYLLNNRCEKCDNSCRTCEIEATNCTGCKDNFFLENNKCYQCSNCKEQEDDSCKCKSCDNTFYLDFYQCKKCINDCLTCESANKCLSCKDLYYLENDQCKLCPSPSNCKTREINSCKCSSCNEGFFLHEKECIQCNDDAKCNIFEDEEKCKCKVCVEGFYTEKFSCKKCDDNCLTCDGGKDGENNHCLSCKNETDKYLLIDENRHICVNNCSEYNATLSANKTMCEVEKKDDKGGKKDSNDNTDYLLWIFASVIGIALIVISICICKKIFSKKNDIEEIDEMSGELMERNELIK